MAVAKKETGGLMNFQTRAILFDLDGTLLDTLDDLTDSMNAVLTSLDFPSHPANSYKYFVGDGIGTLARRALPKDKQTPETVKQCVEGMLKEYEQRWDHKTKLYEGVAPLLDELAKKDIQIAIFSNKPDPFTQKTVKRFLSGWQFSYVAGALPGVPKKPDPTGALAIAHHLKIPPQGFLYVGDTNTDMLTALAADMYPVAALWGFRSKNELHDAGAKILLEHPLDLMHNII